MTHRWIGTHPCLLELVWRLCLDLDIHLHKEVTAMTRDQMNVCVPRSMEVLRGWVRPHLFPHVQIPSCLGPHAAVPLIKIHTIVFDFILKQIQDLESIRNSKYRGCAIP